MQRPRIPVGLSKTEMVQVLTLIDGMIGLIVKLLYARGLRISEAARLRVQDIDFEFKQITVVDGKGKKERVTPLVNNLVALLQVHLEKIKIIHSKDLKEGMVVCTYFMRLVKNTLMRIKTLTGNMYFLVGVYCYRPTH